MTEPIIAPTKFDLNTQNQFLKSKQTCLGSDSKVIKNAKSGTIVPLMNVQGKTMFGVAEMCNWPGTNSPCRQRNDQDRDNAVYNDDYEKYNLYLICIGNVRIFRNPISFKTIRDILGVNNDDKRTTNMWKNGNWRNFSKVFITEVDGKTAETLKLIQRYNQYIISLL